jgi:hypothetical protein
VAFHDTAEADDYRARSGIARDPVQTRGHVGCYGYGERGAADPQSTTVGLEKKCTEYPLP